MDQKITESHLPGQYLDIALVAGQYKIYCPALAFDLPTQSVTYHVKLPKTILVVFNYKIMRVKLYINMSNQDIHCSHKSSIASYSLVLYDFLTC